MRILAIETSCDETAIAIVESEGAFPALRIRVLANTLLSQAEIHRPYGGVFPALAKREHAKALVPLLTQALKEAKLWKKTSRHVIEHPMRPALQEIFEREPELFSAFLADVPEIDPPAFDAIAVTEGPGLEPALWVGINFAKALSLIWNIPVIPIDHMEGHLLAPLLETEGESLRFAATEFPVLALLVSGGHTELILMKGWGSYEVIGETRDDAVGEAFDKVARILGLPYPGGPEIARLAETGTPGRFDLPRPMLRSGDLAFSFAGLKTAVLYLVERLPKPLSDGDRADIARAFEDACVEVLVAKTLEGGGKSGARTFILGGGVAANVRLRTALASAIESEFPGAPLYTPGKGLATDNALMIAVAALANKRATKRELRAQGNMRLG